MPSPFPGMDPYLEEAGLWGDVPHELICTTREILTARLRPKYYVRIYERVYVSDEEDPVWPVLVLDLKPGDKLNDKEFREAYLEVTERETRTVVTVIEIISPTNNVSGSQGQASYLKKRREIIASPCHLMEIDLLRKGAPLLSRELLSIGDYFVHVSRAEKRPQSQVWPIRLQDRLPVVPVPLKPEDGDVELDLQRVLDTGYDRADYEANIDYHEPPDVLLTADQAAWADEILKAKGLRLTMYLGIEIGGTKLQIGLGPGDGTLASLWRGTVEPAKGADGIRHQITAAVPELLQKANLPLSTVKGVGIGFGGPVDDRDHTVIKSHQIEGWDNFPLADWISDLLSLPAALGNDADCAGLAEALFGAGKGLSPIFYITIGSGIGGGLIINGEIYRGSGRGAAEIGHLSTRYEAGTILEDNCSGWAIARFASAWLGEDRLRNSLLRRMVGGNLEALTAKHVSEAAAQGDELALIVLDAWYSDLADGICVMIALLCPRRIVIGGGVSLMGEKLLFEPLRRLVAERVFRPFADCYDIVPAALGEEVVVHGALALARKRLGGNEA